jgi:hypothetical protein
MADDFSEKVKFTHVALIHETWRESAARDLTTIVCFLLLWSVGHWASSAALEWVGVAIGGLFLFTRCCVYLKKSVDTRMTPKQARLWLDFNFPESKEDK